MQFRFRCAAVLTAVLLCSAAALPALAEETATPETADSVASVSTYTGWKTVNGKDYWYENGVKQGTTGRGKEIYDPDSDAWYWLDAVQGGAMTVNKDVYQESNGGKWVRYDANGHMIKGWDTNDDGTYYFDLITGAMAKGDIVVDNLPCSFDTTTGIGCNLMWHSMDGKDYWYEAGKRQGYDPNNAAYRGKEIYDPASDAWYWLDNVQQLRHALADHLAQGINIVGIQRHDIAVGVAVKVFDGQRLHMGKHFIAQVLQGALGNVSHHTGLGKGGNNADAVKACRAGDGMGQAGKITALLFQQGQDVAIDQGLHEQSALHVGKHADKNADDDRNDLNAVAFHHIAQDAHEDLAGVLDFGARAAGAAAANLNHFCFLLSHCYRLPFRQSRRSLWSGCYKLPDRWGWWPAFRPGYRNH